LKTLFDLVPKLPTLYEKYLDLKRRLTYLRKNPPRILYLFSDLTDEKMPFYGKDRHFSLSPTPLPGGEGRRGEGETMNGF